MTLTIELQNGNDWSWILVCHCQTSMTMMMIIIVIIMIAWSAIVSDFPLRTAAIIPQSRYQLLELMPRTERDEC